MTLPKIDWVRPKIQIICLFMLLLLAGCKSRDENAVRVAIFTSDVDSIKIFNNAMRQIESRHPGLKIILANIPYNDFQNKITTMMAAGNAPDVVSTEANNFVDLYQRGAFEDLTDLAKRDGIDPDSFYATILKRYSPGGKIYALPTDIAPFGLVYYNKKIFDEVGLPYPTSKWKWPEPLLSICQKLVKKDSAGKLVRWAWADPYATTAENFLLDNGGYFTDSDENPTRLALDSDRALEAFRFRWDLIYTYHVSPTPSQVSNFNFGQGAEDMFANGLVAMMPSGIWHTPKFLKYKDLSFDVVEFPWGPHGTRGWGSGGSGYAMTKGSKKKEQAWIVIKELAGEDIEAQVAQTGLVQPALVKVAQSDAFLKSPGPASKKILLNMPNEAHFGPFMKNWNEIWYGQVGPAMDRVWNGDKTPEQVLPKLVKDLNRKYFGVK
jgi:ABC-type glycerol-3-phosphate transport system substrate-binding protein